MCSSDLGLIPAFQPLYDYSWAVGLVVGFLVFLVLSMPGLSRAPSPRLAEQRG